MLGDVAVDRGRRSAIRPKLPRRSRLRSRTEKRLSTAFVPESVIGVKWKIQRGSQANEARTSGCL